MNSALYFFRKKLESKMILKQIEVFLCEIESNIL